MIKVKHALVVNPYFGDSTALVGVFPPTGLEYIVASMKDLVGKVTLLDLRYEKTYQDPKALSRFIRDEIDLICISIRWDFHFDSICDFVSQLPPEVRTVAFAILSRNIQMISTSEIKISVVVEEKYLELAVRTLHSAFGLETAAAAAR